MKGVNFSNGSANISVLRKTLLRKDKGKGKAVPVLLAEHYAMKA
jgi:hypothetical protein